MQRVADLEQKNMDLHTQIVNPPTEIAQLQQQFQQKQEEAALQFKAELLKVSREMSTLQNKFDVLSREKEDTETQVDLLAQKVQEKTDLHEEAARER